MALPENNESGGPWSCRGLMPQDSGMLEVWEQWCGRNWVGQYPHGGKGKGERADVGCGVCGGVTAKRNIM